MKILAIETSQTGCSVALYSEGKSFSRSHEVQRQQSEVVLGFVASLLNEASLTLSDLTAIAFTCGPGAFTGVRIGASVVQGLSFASGVPVIPVSTLAGFAQAGFHSAKINHAYVAVDARMGDVYAAEYQLNERGLMTLVGEESVGPLDNFLTSIQTKGDAIGSGFSLLSEVERLKLFSKINTEFFMTSLKANDIVPLALERAEKGVFLPSENAVPVYLRDDLNLKKS
jgi:tRNA threonylcarbamoyladenosine biosynthesis protein TsaB